MRICLILEGVIPTYLEVYPPGCTSISMKMKEHEFVLWVIGAKAENRGKFVYEFSGKMLRKYMRFFWMMR